MLASATTPSSGVPRLELTGTGLADLDDQPLVVIREEMDELAAHRPEERPTITIKTQKSAANS
jgi:hypothetical protein